MTQPSPAWLDATAVEGRMKRVDAVAAMRDLFEAYGQGRVTQPAQVLALLPDSRGDFITYSGILAEDGVFGVKVSPYVVSPSGGKVTATTMLVSLETGQPLLFCDSLALTTERTAATTALAVSTSSLDLMRPIWQSSAAVLLPWLTCVTSCRFDRGAGSAFIHAISPPKRRPLRRALVNSGRFPRSLTIALSRWRMPMWCCFVHPPAPLFYPWTISGPGCL